MSGSLKLLLFMKLLCVHACVCLPLRLSITSGVMRHDKDPI